MICDRNDDFVLNLLKSKESLNDLLFECKINEISTKINEIKNFNTKVTNFNKIDNKNEFKNEIDILKKKELEYKQRILNMKEKQNFIEIKSEFKEFERNAKLLFYGKELPADINLAKKKILKLEHELKLLKEQKNKLLFSYSCLEISNWNNIFLKKQKMVHR